jgi:phage protein D
VDYDELVQYYCSDWDFMLSRAEINGLLVMVDDAKVVVKAPETAAASSLTVTYGQDLMELEAGMDARCQFDSVKAAAWDPQN